VCVCTCVCVYVCVVAVAVNSFFVQCCAVVEVEGGRWKVEGGSGVWGGSVLFVKAQSLLGETWNLTRTYIE